MDRSVNHSVARWTRVKIYVLASLATQVLLSLALLGVSIFSDATVKLASDYAKLAVEQKLVFKAVGANSHRLMEEVQSDRPNLRLVQRIQRSLDAQRMELVEISERVRAAAFGQVGLSFLSRPPEAGAYDAELALLDQFLSDVQSLAAVPTDRLLYAESFVNRIDVATSPRSVISRGVDALSQNVQNQTTIILKRLERLRLIFVGAIVLVVVSLGAFLIMPALSDLASALKRESALRRKMEIMAHHDQMTGLLNRAGLEHAVTQLPPGTDYAFSVVDLNNFKPINDTFGHAAGDAVLMAVAQRLKECAGAAIVARLGGDEFSVLDTSIRSEAKCLDFGTALKTVFDEPVPFGDRQFAIGGVIGIAHSARFGGDFDEVVSAADAAMYDMKGSGKSGVGLYTPALAANVHNLEHKSDLEQAIKRHDIRPWFQPKVHIETGDIVGFEALARWHHPERDVLCPAAFLDDLDRYQLHLMLSYEMIVQVLQTMRGWKTSGFEVLPVAINISPEVLARKETVDDLLWKISEFGDVSHLLTIELTEDVFIGRILDSVRNSIHKLIETGIRLSIDDFGSGYASFRHLKEFPLHELKIDQSFVQDIGSEPSADVLLAAFASIAKGLDLAVVAEGIETEQQRQFLLSLGCEIGQGFLFAPALKEVEARQWLNRPQISGDKAAS